MRRPMTEAERKVYSDKGRKAYRDGVPYSHCPYLTFPDCEDGKSWQNGWLAEKENRRANQQITSEGK